MRASLAGLLLAGAALVGARDAAALTVQEAILRAKPAVALITTEVRADVTMNCGQGPVTVSPAPFVETGTGWFVDGRGWVVTNAHVVDPAHRLPAWVTHELKKKAIEQACVGPALRARGLLRRPPPDVGETNRRPAPPPGGGLPAQTPPTPPPKKKIPPPPLLPNNGGRPLPDSGRDLALLRVKD